MDKKSLLAIVKKAAKQAGDFLYEDRGSLKNVLSEDGRDIKIEADIQSEAMIINYLCEES